MTKELLCYYQFIFSLLFSFSFRRIDTQNWFDTLLDERNEFCSVSSSACPSITSELSDFDALMNDSLSQETLVQHTQQGW